MKGALTLLRFASGLLGGKWMIAMWIAAIVAAYAALINAAFFPVVVFSRDSLSIDMCGKLAVGATLGGVLALNYVRHTRLRFPLWQLAPASAKLTRALMAAIGILIVASAIPAIALTAYSSTRERFINAVRAPNWRIQEFFLGEVPVHGYAAEALLLALLCALTFVVFGRPRSRINFAAVPIQIAAVMSQTSSNSWWWPIVIFVAIPIGEYIWNRWFGDRPINAKSPQLDQRRLSPRTGWLMQRRVTKAASAFGANAQKKRFAALLVMPTEARTFVLSILLLALLLALQPSAMMTDSFIWWIPAYSIMIVVARPTSLPVARIVLLPIAAHRKDMGTLLARTWSRDIVTRLLIACVLGTAVRALSWGIGWPAFLHGDFVSNGDTLTHLLGAPLAYALGLIGVAVSMSLISSASPRLLANASTIAGAGILGAVVLGLTALGFKTLIQMSLPALHGNDAGLLLFAVINGVLLPACALALNQALRHQWATAQLAEVSSGMRGWRERLQKMSAQFPGHRS